MKKQLRIWLEAIRLRTLPVSLSGVIMAMGIAQWYGKFNWIPALLCVAFAVLAQIASNLANEYYDFLSGADKAGRVGPRRGVTEGDIKPWLVPVGAFIALGVLAYSTGPYPLSYHGLGELAVFIFYGLIPVNFSYYIIAGHFSPLALLASITIGFMGVNVLLVNNYRDVDDDRDAGKRTSVVIFGRKPAAAAYLINGFMAISFLAPLWLLLAFSGKISAWSLAIPVLYLVMHTATWNKLTHRDGAALNPLLGATARNMLIFTVLMAISLSVF